VCPGVYVEQVTVPAGKDGLTLFSEIPQAAIIKAPPVMLDPKAIVRISESHDVTVRHFTISGPGPGPCDSIRWGVRVDTGGSATIRHNHITQIRDTPFSGCQNGVAVLVGRAREVQSASAIVRNNLIDLYQKGGIVVDGVGSYGEIRENEVIGFGATTVTAQNGIQISRDAHAQVHHNRVSKNQFGTPPVATDVADAVGILLYNLAGGVQASYNDVLENEDGIALANFDGDFHLGPTVNVEVSHNTSRNNVLDGIDAFEETAKNPISYNKSLYNGLYDCADFTDGPYNPPAFVANPWVKDMGNKENRAGLCKSHP
jgi:hypothetical protein